VNPDASLSLSVAAANVLAARHDAAARAAFVGASYRLRAQMLRALLRRRVWSNRYCRGRTAGKAEPAENTVRS